MFTKMMATSLAIIGFLASVAGAQESQTSTMAAPKPSRMNVYDPVGWFPFIGLSGGYMSPNDDLLTEGAPMDLRLIGSLFGDSRHSVWDFGLGFMGDSFTQKSGTMNNFISGGVAEVAWRYNSTGRWQFGPIVDAYIGGGDRYGSTDPTWTTFAGLQLLKEIPVKGANMFRIGLKGFTDLSIPGATVNSIMLDLQWGFGADQKAPEVAQTQEPPATPPAEEARLTTPTSTEAAMGAAAAAGAVAGTRRVIESDTDAGTLTIRNDERMQFGSNKVALSSDNVDYVRKVGTALAQRPDLFGKVEVVGFADQTGTQKANMVVSKNRAQTVTKILKDKGVRSDKITTSWKGSKEPLYQSLLPEDMQQNRRVDLIFHGVKDPAALESLLNSVQ